MRSSSSCHPGTRLDIIGQARLWVHDPARKQKIMWVHGPARVGKSTIMQSLAQEESNTSPSVLGATMFLPELRERNDPKLLFNSIAYQLAAQFKRYYEYVVSILTKDPKILMTSMKERFRRFIVIPFTEKKVLPTTTLILLDGLDELGGGASVQSELVALIGQFVGQHPTSCLMGRCKSP